MTIINCVYSLLTNNILIRAVILYFTTLTNSAGLLVATYITYRLCQYISVYVKIYYAKMQTVFNRYRILSKKISKLLETIENEEVKLISEEKEYVPLGAKDVVPYVEEYRPCKEDEKTLKSLCAVKPFERKKLGASIEGNQFQKTFLESKPSEKPKEIYDIREVIEKSSKELSGMPVDKLYAANGDIYIADEYYKEINRGQDKKYRIEDEYNLPPFDFTNNNGEMNFTPMTKYPDYEFIMDSPHIKQHIPTNVNAIKLTPSENINLSHIQAVKSYNPNKTNMNAIKLTSSENVNPFINQSINSNPVHVSKNPDEIYADIRKESDIQNNQMFGPQLVTDPETLAKIYEMNPRKRMELNSDNQSVGTLSESDMDTNNDVSSKSSDGFIPIENNY